MKHCSKCTGDIEDVFFFFFQAEDGIRDLVRSRGLGDVYKRQEILIEINTKMTDLGHAMFT